MFENRLRIQPSIGIWPVIMLTVAGVMLVMSLATGSIHWAIGGIWPLLTGGGLYLAKESGCTLSFGDDSVRVEESGKVLKYGEIEALCYRGREASPHYPLDVFTAEDRIRIPTDRSASNWEIYRFLVSRLSPFGSRVPISDLVPHVKNQIATFGRDKVFSYSGREPLKNTFVRRKIFCAGLAALLSALAWIVISAQFNPTIRNDWIAGSVMLIVFGFVVVLLAFVQRTSSQHAEISPWIIFFGALPYLVLRNAATKKLKNSGLIVSPLGLAVVQGDLKGEIRWKELTSVKMVRYETTDARFSSHRPRYLELNIQGTVIKLLDVYERPLSIIHDRIMAYLG